MGIDVPDSSEDDSSDDQVKNKKMAKGAIVAGK